MRPIFLICLAVLSQLLLSPLSLAKEQDSIVIEQFLEAARARDFDGMRQILQSPIVVRSGVEIDIEQFIELIEPCKQYYYGAFGIAWTCPAYVPGGPCYTWNASPVDAGDKLQLIGLTSILLPKCRDEKERAQ